MKLEQLGEFPTTMSTPVTSPVTSPVPGTSANAARSKDADAQVKKITDTIDKLIAWNKARHKATKRVLGHVDGRQVVEKFDEIASKLEYLDAEKEHLVSALAAAEYEETFVSAEIVLLLNNLQIINDKIEVNNAEYAKGLEQETENLRRFRLFITEALKVPILADIIADTRDDPKAERRPWLEVSAMVEEIQAQAFAMYAEAKKVSLKRTEDRVNTGLDRIQDVTRGKLDELQVRVDKALDPIESFDAEEWRSVQEKLANLESVSQSFEVRIEAEMAVGIENARQAQRAEEDVKRHSMLLAVADDTCAALVAGLSSIILHQKRVSEAWASTRIWLSTCREKLAKKDEDMEKATETLKDLRYESERKVRSLEKSKRIIAEHQKKEQAMEDMQITQNKDVLHLQSQLQQSRRFEEQQTEQRSIADATIATLAYELIVTIPNRAEGFRRRIRSLHGWIAAQSNEHREDVAVLTAAYETTIARAVTTMDQLHDSIAAAGLEIQSWKQKHEFAEVQVQEDASIREEMVKTLKETSDMCEYNMQQLGARYHARLRDKDQELQKATRYGQEQEQLANQLQQQIDNLNGKVSRLEQQLSESIFDRNTKETIYSAQLDELKRQASDEKDALDNEIRNWKQRIQEITNKSQVDQDALQEDLRRAADNASQAQRNHTTELQMAKDASEALEAKANATNMELRRVQVESTKSQSALEARLGKAVQDMTNTKQSLQQEMKRCSGYERYVDAITRSGRTITLRVEELETISKEQKAAAERNGQRCTDVVKQQSIMQQHIKRLQQQVRVSRNETAHMKQKAIEEAKQVRDAVDARHNEASDSMKRAFAEAKTNLTDLLLIVLQSTLGLEERRISPSIINDFLELAVACRPSTNIVHAQSFARPIVFWLATRLGSSMIPSWQSTASMRQVDLPWFISTSRYLLQESASVTAKQVYIQLHHLSMIVGRTELDISKVVAIRDILGELGKLHIVNKSAMLSAIQEDAHQPGEVSWATNAVLRAKAAETSDTVYVLDSGNSDIGELTLLCDPHTNLFCVLQYLGQQGETAVVFEYADIVECRWSQNDTVILRINTGPAISNDLNNIVIQRKLVTGSGVLGWIMHVEKLVKFEHEDQKHQ